MVAVQDGTHLLGREIEIGFGAVANDEAMAIAMAEDRALHFGHQLVADGSGGLG
jgi:hypothetical protein